MTPQTESALYLERARETLHEARDNLNLGYYHVATSRAYYAMFYAAHALLASQDISRSKHSGVHAAFSQYFVKPGLIEPQYGHMLTRAFNVRLDSDYAVSFTPERDLAEGILHDAEQFVARVAVYFQPAGGS